MIESSIEIDRKPEDVFAYLADLERHGEWQSELLESKLQTSGPIGVGTRVSDTRKVPGGRSEMTYEVTEHDPPRKSSWRGVNGPIRANGSVIVEPVCGRDAFACHHAARPRGPRCWNAACSDCAYAGAKAGTRQLNQA